jgi:nucleoside-diphosphate-sugar epimerase
MPKLFIIGFGYSAGFLAKELVPQGWQVVGTRRSPSTPSYHLLGSDDSDDSVPILAYPAGNQAIPPALLDELPTASHLLITVPPTADGCPVAHDFASLSLSLPALRWIGYCSATNVYGDHGGDWVDEDSPCKAKPGSRGGNRLLAEQQWRQLAADKGWPAPIVFRLAGIYGPGRSALDRVARAIALQDDSQLVQDEPLDSQLVSVPAGGLPPVSDNLPPIGSGAMVSRIHVVDIARLIAASMMQQSCNPPPHTSQKAAYKIYNVADSLPAPTDTVLAYAASLLGHSVPASLLGHGLDNRPPTASASIESKKVDGQRILQELNATLCYPSYREGLQAISAQNTCAQAVADKPTLIPTIPFPPSFS